MLWEAGSVVVERVLRRAQLSSKSIILRRKLTICRRVCRGWRVQSIRPAEGRAEPGEQNFATVLHPTPDVVVHVVEHLDVQLRVFSCIQRRICQRNVGEKGEWGVLRDAETQRPETQTPRHEGQEERTMAGRRQGRVRRCGTWRPGLELISSRHRPISFS